MLRLRRPALPVALAALLALAGCGGQPASEDDAEPAARPLVRAVSLAWHSFERGLDATGQWRSATETVVQAPFDAVIEAIDVHPGVLVTRGQTIGRWSTYESEAALEGARLWREQAADSAAAREAERALAAARRGVVHVPILAPVTGTVVRCSGDAGARLAAGAELLAIVADQDVVFEARVRAADAGAVRVGMPATIADGSGPPREARVLTRLPSAGGDQTALVWLRPLGGGERPDLGRFGTARLLPGGRVRALAVPDSAIVQDDLTGTNQVAVVDSGGRVAWRVVRPGPRDGVLRGIEGDGLAAGLRVVVEGQRALSDGVTVNVRP